MLGQSPFLSRHAFLARLSQLAANASNVDPDGDAPALAASSGVDLLRAWHAGQLPSSVLAREPPEDWSHYTHPVMPLLSFRYPPEWSARSHDAGYPLGVRLLTPDHAAGFEVMLGAPVRGQAPEHLAHAAAWAGLERLLGATIASTPRDLSMIDRVTWLEDGEMARALLGAEGDGTIAVAQAFAAGDALGGVVPQYRVMAGPRAQFTELTERIFLPILSQFQARE